MYFLPPQFYPSSRVSCLFWSFHFSQFSPTTDNKATCFISKSQNLLVFFVSSHRDIFELPDNLLMISPPVLRWGPWDIRGFWQRWCSNSPWRSGGGNITKCPQPAEKKTGSDPSQRNHRGRRGWGRRQGWWDRLCLVALFPFTLPSAWPGNSGNSAQIWSHSNVSSSTYLGSSSYFGSWTYPCNPCLLFRSVSL